MNKRILAIAAVLIGGGFLAGFSTRSAPLPLPYYADVTLTPRFVTGAGERETMHVVGDFSLRDQQGASVSRADVAGRVYVASFFYTECRTLCPDLKAQLTRVHETFSSDTGVMILTHTVAPADDDVGRLAHYAKLNGIDHRQWRLLTGSLPEIERLARERYFVELSDTTGNTSGKLAHTETLVLVDGAGHIRGVYDGSLAFEVSQLIADIRTLRLTNRS